MHSRKQNRQAHENLAALYCRTAPKILKPSTNIDFLPLFHIKHCLKSGVLPPLNPSALPPALRQSKDKSHRAVQTRALYSLAIIPRNLHGTPRSIQFRVDLNTLARSRSIHNRDKRSFRNAAQPRALRIYLRYPHATTRRAFKAHIRNSPAPPRITLYYNSSLFSVAFSPLSVSFRPILRQTELIVRLNIPQRLSFARTPPDNPFACRPHTLHRSATRRHPASARFSRPVRAPSARSAAAFAAELPFDAPSCLFRLPLFPQAVQGSAFLCVLVSCGTYVLSFAKTSTFIEVFARLCIFIHCVIAYFSPICLLFPPMRSLSRCRSVADDRASAPLRRFCFRAPHRRPGLPFSSALVCIPFFRGRTPSFLISRSLFASCSMAHRKLFVCFSLLPAFRAFPSMTRSASSPVFD